MSSLAGPRDHLGWIVPLSLVVHAVVITALPAARRAVAKLPPPPVVLDFAPPPEPPPPPPPAPEPEPTPAPAAAPVARVASAPVAARAEAPRAAATNDAPAGPVDFTSTTFSGDGAGVAVGGGGGGGGGTAPAAAKAPAAAVAAGPRLVDARSLARKPRAPGLDAELERQYPAEARRSGIAGTAVLRVRILPDGRVGPVNVVSTTWAGFGPACERTVRAAQWEAPLDREGSAVATEITYTCRFEVRS